MLERDLRQIQKQYEWPENYYMETSPELRKKLLKKALEEEASTENRLRDSLYTARYSNSTGKSDGTDHFMKCWMGISFLPQQRRKWFGERKYRVNLQQILDTFQLNLLEEHKEYQELWYQEFINFFCFYIQISMTDKSYSTAMFGVGKLSEESIAIKIADDFCERNIRIPKMLGFYDKMNLLSEAAKDAYSLYFPKYLSIYEEKAGKE